jgi:hypothetical protein
MPSMLMRYNCSLHLDLAVLDQKRSSKRAMIILDCQNPIASNATRSE